RLSHTIGSTREPLVTKTIGEYFRDQARTFGDRQALVVPPEGLRWTYTQFEREVEACAKGLLQMGLRKGDRLGIWMGNRSEWITLQYATSMIGVILVTINPAYRPNELESALRLSGCRALVMSPTFKSSNYLKMLRTVAPEFPPSLAGNLMSESLPDLRTVIVVDGARHPGAFAFHDLLDEGRGVRHDTIGPVLESCKKDEVCNIQFTSGTTGSPKAASLTHSNILNNGIAAGRAMRLTCEDILCVPVPLYHCFGIVLGNLAALSAGASVVYPAESYDPVATMQAVHDERCTGLHGVPTMFIGQMSLPNFSSFDVSSLRTGIMAGSVCPPETMKGVMQKLHMKDVVIGYGMTGESLRC
ncbi:hypothetical protein BDK51DRAFT_2250, partial [Blyttiomyces helicus]